MRCVKAFQKYNSNVNAFWWMENISKIVLEFYSQQFYKPYNQLWRIKPVISITCTESEEFQWSINEFYDFRCQFTNLPINLPFNKEPIY